jgi:nucleotide-binding universal stress UspA family protein
MAGSDPLPSRPGTVVAATDLSETANAGVRWAVHVARDKGLELHLIHALNLAGWATDYGELEAKVPVQLEDAARQHLDRIARETQQLGVTTTWQVRIGQPSEIIVEEARRLEAELVTIGSSGHRPIEAPLLGSTAERVVQRATCPVLTVHPGDRPPGRQIRKLLVATDFSAASKWALATSIELLNGADSNPPEVLLLHVYHVPYEFSMDSIYGPAAPDASVWEAVAREVGSRLEGRAQALDAELKIDVEPLKLGGYPPQVIVRQAVEAEVDWIVLGTHGRTGLAHVLLGSTAERVIQEAPCPVLTVRRSMDESTHLDLERR